MNDPIKNKEKTVAELKENVAAGGSVVALTYVLVAIAGLFGITPEIVIAIMAEHGTTIVTGLVFVMGALKTLIRSKLNRKKHEGDE